MLDSRPAPLRHAGFVLAALGVLMASVDGTIMIVALPQLTESLQTSLTWVGWTLTSYQLVQIVMFPLAGKLCEALGARRVFLSCVVAFTVASLLCAMAPNVYVLIVFRALQAVGGGGLMPSVIGMVVEEYPRHRAQAIGLISSVMPIGSIVGPNLGGLLLELWGWRAMFLINVPIGIAIVLGFWLLVPRAEAPPDRSRLRVDVLGLAKFTGAIIALMVGTTAIADDTALVGSPLVWVLFALSLILGIAFVRHVKATPNAVMDYELLAGRPFLAANLYNVLLGAVTMGFYSFIPYYAVVKYGLTPFESGAVLTPRAIVVVVVSAMASLFLSRLGNRLPMILGLVFVGANFLLMAQGWDAVPIGPWTLGGFWLLAVLLAIGGLGMGIANPASNNAAIDIAPEKAGAITGIRGTFRLAGGTISISCVVLALSFFSDQAAGLDLIYMVFTGVLLLSVPLVLLIPEPSPDIPAPARHRPREVREPGRERALPRMTR